MIGFRVGTEARVRLDRDRREERLQAAGREEHLGAHAPLSPAAEPASGVCERQRERPRQGVGRGHDNERARERERGRERERERKCVREREIERERKRERDKQSE